MKTHKDLDVWKKSVELVTSIYKITKSFPKEEIYGLTSQMRRAAISVPSNIAEGRAKLTTREFMRFLSIANGSIAELETQIIIAEKLGYLLLDCQKSLLDDVDHVGRMLSKLRAGLEKRLSSNS